MEKRGQVTIFIIVGLILVGSAVVFFGVKGGFIPSIGGGAPASTNAFLSACLQDRVKEVAEDLSVHGGYYNNPTSVNFKFEDEGIYRNITYLCYTQNNFKPCIVQKPAFYSDIQKNIEEEIGEDVQGCFDDMIDSFDKNGYEIISKRFDGFEVNFAPKRIIIQTDSELTLSKAGETSTESNFQVVIPSRIYELLNVAQLIVESESNYCYFESVGYHLEHPEFTIDLFRMEDSTEIYTVGYQDTNEEFRFAVRGCNFNA